MNPLWQDTLLLTLLHEGGLFRLGSHFAQQNAHFANQQWSQRIQWKPASFLRDYDLLFRQVTHGLISKGYAFSAEHPHQTLKQLLLAYGETIADIDNMIACRHALKYSQISHANPSAIATLQRLLQVTAIQAQAYVTAV